MEWLALAMWILVAGLGLLLGLGVAIGHGLLGVQMLAALGGLTLIVVYLFVGEPATLAWIAFGLGVVGTITIALAAYALMVPPVAALPTRTQYGAELHAGLSGAQLPLFLVVALFTLLTALDVLTTGT
jgi:hypothetical protein